MKRILALYVAVACSAVSALAQAAAPSQSPPAQAQTSAPANPPGATTPPATPGQSAPATTQPGQAAPATGQPGQAAPAPAQPARNQHVAKTRAEYDAYLDAMSKTDLPSAEAAAVEFEKNFPDSDLKGVLYQHLMDKYQEANNAPKMLEMARKVIQFEPDDPVALSTAATILAETTHDTDPDRDQRFAESEADARHAIASIDTLPSPANWTIQQFQQAKNVILSYAHAAIGFVELRKGNNVEAEKELRTATQLNQSQPDAPTWYRLALALDHQQKYPDALAAINHALELFRPDDAMYSVAKDEQARLTQILGQPAPPPSPSGSTGNAAAAPSPTPNPNPAGSKPAAPANPAPPPPKR